MDIDPPTGYEKTKKQQNDKKTKIHPLAVVGITDHFTRVSMGGTPMPTNAPAVGLLFGHCHQGQTSTVSIMDSLDIEYSLSLNDEAQISGNENNTQQEYTFGGLSKEQKDRHKNSIVDKIKLHQKVFPMRKLVGWYRVFSSSDTKELGEPSQTDLQIQTSFFSKLIQRLSPDLSSPLFLLMNLSGAIDQTQQQKDAIEEDLQEAELPINIFESVIDTENYDSSTSSSPSVVFVNVDFELDTFEPERIAVEKVLKSQPNAATHTSGTNYTLDNKQDKNDMDDATDDEDEKTNSKKEFTKKRDKNTKKSTNNKNNAQVPCKLDNHLKSLKSSVLSLNARVAILINFLTQIEQDAASQQLSPTHLKLLREVDGLVRKLPSSSSFGNTSTSPLSDTIATQNNDALLLSYLATISKSVRTVDSLAQKCRVIEDAKAREKELRRGF